MYIKYVTPPPLSNRVFSPQFLEAKEIFTIGLLYCCHIKQPIDLEDNSFASSPYYQEAKHFEES
jgi:hypothetical protein